MHTALFRDMTVGSEACLGSFSTDNTPYACHLTSQAAVDFRLQLSILVQTRHTCSSCRTQGTPVAWEAQSAIDLIAEEYAAPDAFPIWAAPRA